jgi:hypothetical protein
MVGDQSVRGLLQFSPCQLLLLEAGSWGTGIVREPRVRATSAFENRYETSTVEGTADWDELVRAVVNCGSRDSSVGIATDYGLDEQEGHEFESR